MSPADIIRMAREAGLPFRELDDAYCESVGLPRGTVGAIDGVTIGDVQRFAELVKADAVAAERKAFADAVASSAAVPSSVAAAIRAGAQKGGAL